MARMGKLERQIKAGYFRAEAMTRDAIVARNLSQPKPDKPLLSRDETAILKGNTYTRGFSLGQRITHFQKKGTFRNA